MSTATAPRPTAANRIHAGQPVAADRHHEYDEHLVDVTLTEGAARSLINDLIKTVNASDTVRHGLISALTRKADPVTDNAARGAVDRLLYLADTTGDFTITLDVPQAETLAEQLDAACVPPARCRCGSLVESHYADTCGVCMDGGR